MSSKRREFVYDLDEELPYLDFSQRKQKRKEKRLKNALKSRDVDYFYEDDYEYEQHQYRDNR